MAAPLPDEFVFVPLGGVGEIGMNMGAYGFGPRNARKWIVVDCGVTFAGPTEPGIDLIMADPSFLEDHADDVLALVLTHSHEDHYGAVLDLWPAFDRPVYATAFTAAMLSAKRAADNIVDNVTVRKMEVGKPFSLGPFTIEAINVAHSIPESCALAITTPIGRVIHTGDWKLDPRPIAARADRRGAAARARQRGHSDRAHLRFDQCAQGRRKPQRRRGRGDARRADRRMRRIASPSRPSPPMSAASSPWRAPRTRPGGRS